MLSFLSRGQHCLHAERFNPQLAALALGVVQMFILLLLHLFMCVLQNLALFTFGFLCAFADQFPIIFSLYLLAVVFAISTLLLQ